MAQPARTAANSTLHAAGFTLIELLVAIAIVALLISITMPSLGAARAVARQMQCASNLRQLGVAAQVYANDFNDVVVPTFYDGRLWNDVLFNGPESFSGRGVLPDPGNGSNAVYSREPWIHHCPSNPYRVNFWRDTSYTANYAMSGWSDNPAHELSKNGNPGPRWVYLSRISVPSSVVHLADAAEAGDSGEPAGSAIGPQRVLQWRDTPGFGWHRDRSNFLMLDNHVQALSADSYQQRYDNMQLFWKRNHDSWW